MKILILTEVFFPDIIGGAGKYTYQIASSLVKRGHGVFVINRSIKELPAQETIEGIKVIRISWPGCGNPFNPFIFLKSVRAAFKALSLEVRFDLIVFNQPLSAFAVILSKRSKGIPKVYNFQSSWADEFEIKSFLRHHPWLPQVILKRILLSPVIFLMRAIERRVIAKSNQVVTLSQYMKERMQHLCRVPSEKIKIIPAGVDTNEFKPLEPQERDSLRSKLGISKESFVLFTARNLVPRMGLDNLIKAYKILVKENPQIELIIAGGGFLGNKLKSLARSLNLSDRVRFPGSLKGERLVQYYQACDLFILPTQFLEGFGISTIEALASGLPALGTPVGGTIEILSRFDRNFLFAGSDPESIAEKISEFIKNSQDRELLSRHCRQFILENYSLERFSGETEKLYLSVAQKRGRI